MKDARDLYDDTMVRGVPVLDWAAVQQAPPIDRALSPMRPYFWCCGLKPGHNMIDFDKDCSWDNFAAPNFTDAAMPFPSPPSEQDKDNATEIIVRDPASLAPDKKSLLQTAVTLRRWRGAAGKAVF